VFEGAVVTVEKKERRCQGDIKEERHRSEKFRDRRIHGGAIQRCKKKRGSDGKAFRLRQSMRGGKNSRWRIRVRGGGQTFLPGGKIFVVPQQKGGPHIWGNFPPTYNFSGDSSVLSSPIIFVKVFNGLPSPYSGGLNSSICKITCGTICASSLRKGTSQTPHGVQVGRRNIGWGLRETPLTNTINILSRVLQTHWRNQKFLCNQPVGTLLGNRRESQINRVPKAKKTTTVRTQRQAQKSGSHHNLEQKNGSSVRFGFKKTRLEEPEAKGKEDKQTRTKGGQSKTLNSESGRKKLIWEKKAEKKIKGKN